MKKLGLLMLCMALVSAAYAQGQKQPQAKSQKEMEAVQAIFAAPDAAARIKAADDLLLKFADTEFKAVALQVAAASAQEMNDFEKMVLYAERTLEVDPKNYASMLMLASGIAQRTREHDLDKEEKLARSEKYAKEALEILNAAPKPRPDITDEQWDAAKKDFMAQAHEAMGLSAMVRKKYDDAITQFKTAVEMGATPDPATKVRLASVYNSAGKYDEAIAVLDALLAEQDLHPTIRQFASQEKLKAATGKAQKK
ncbi:MAG: tetratricopeptide repeat protein [Acidimicrobiia bacterium]|nr:tetratricopeptide repeat protein [Acidimicrobiia bacterium]